MNLVTTWRFYVTLDGIEHLGLDVNIGIHITSDDEGELLIGIVGGSALPANSCVECVGDCGGQRVVGNFKQDHLQLFSNSL